MVNLVVWLKVATVDRAEPILVVELLLEVVIIEVIAGVVKL